MPGKKIMQQIKNHIEISQKSKSKIDDIFLSARNTEKIFTYVIGHIFTLVLSHMCTFKNGKILMFINIPIDVIKKEYSYPFH